MIILIGVERKLQILRDPKILGSINSPGRPSKPSAPVSPWNNMVRRCKNRPKWMLLDFLGYTQNIVKQRNFITWHDVFLFNIFFYKYQKKTFIVWKVQLIKKNQNTGCSFYQFSWAKNFLRSCNLLTLSKHIKQPFLL
jgi:hypothetical protein